MSEQGRLLHAHAGVPATLDALPAVVAAVAKRVPVLVDGGIRRGTDIIKVPPAVVLFPPCAALLCLNSRDMFPAPRPCPVHLQLLKRG